MLDVIMINIHEVLLPARMLSGPPLEPPPQPASPRADTPAKASPLAARNSRRVKVLFCIFPLPSFLPLVILKDFQDGGFPLQLPRRCASTRRTALRVRVPPIESPLRVPFPDTYRLAGTG